MPSFNASLYISDAIESVIHQNYSNWELLIVDDNSTDSTRSLVSGFLDERIKLIRLKKNSGSPSKPRNIGLSYAKGDYIAFLDSDDLWLSNKLSVQLRFMQREKCLFSCSPYQLFGMKSALYVPPEEVTYDELLINNSIGCLTAIVHKSLLRELEFPECGHEDFSLWLQVLRSYGSCKSVGVVLAKYRVVSNSVSSNKFKVIPFFWHIYRKEEKLGISKSLYYCFRYFINVLWFKYK
tara:strand:+ start:4181 stop:4891 length:711 start_codon:yes stop_codon:yes gene_type:complete